MNSMNSTGKQQKNSFLKKNFKDTILPKQICKNITYAQFSIKYNSTFIFINYFLVELFFKLE